MISYERSHQLHSRSQVVIKGKGLAFGLSGKFEGCVTNPQINMYTGDKDVTINSAINELRKYGYIADVYQMVKDKSVYKGIQAFAYSQGETNGIKQA